MTPWYTISSIILGVLLFFPAKRIILTLTVGRHQKRVGREATQAEMETLTRRAVVLAAIISVTFAFIYNKVIILRYFGPVR